MTLADRSEGISSPRAAGKSEITRPDIIAQTAAYFGPTQDELTGPSCRQSAMARRPRRCNGVSESPPRYCPRSVSSSARDHTTVVRTPTEEINQLLAERRPVSQTSTASSPTASRDAGARGRA